MRDGPALVLSAEHAGRRVPPRWRGVFAAHRGLLDSHRGWDPGSLELARAIARTTGAPLIVNPITRLLADANREPSSPTCFSELTRGLPAEEREAMLAEWHAPHRAAVEAAVRGALGGSDVVVHVSVHSFTPVWKGRVRDVDVGLLHDPRRLVEVAVARRWRRELRPLEPELRVRMNRPYVGWTDGLVTALRERLPPERYVGLELEANQALALGEAARWRRLCRALATSLGPALAGVGP